MPGNELGPSNKTGSRAREFEEHEGSAKFVRRQPCWLRLFKASLIWGLGRVLSLELKLQPASPVGRTDASEGIQSLGLSRSRANNLLDSLDRIQAGRVWLANSRPAGNRPAGV